MQPVDVVLFVEHVARELDIACAIRHLAWQRFGMEVAVESLTHDLDATLRRWQPSAVAVPYFYSRQDMGLHTILERWPGVRAVNLAYEQLVSPGNQQFKVPRDSVARNHVLHLAAGTFFRDFLVRNGVPPDRVVMTGSLACSLYQPPYRSYYEFQRNRLARQYQLDPRRPWIFFPENYGAAFFSDREIERRVKHGCKRSDVEDYRSISRRSLEQVAAWCRRGAELGQSEIIVRPRPAIELETLRAAFEDAAGPLPSQHLHFIQDDTVRHWILASDAVVSSFSTTLVEAAVAERPAYLLMPEAIPPSMHSGWHDLAPTIRTEDEFVDLTQNGGSPFASALLRQWAQSELLGYGDPLAGTVALLAAVAGKDCRLPTVPQLPLLDRMQLEWKRTRRRWKRQLLATDPVPPRSSVPSHDLFTADDIGDRTAAWQSVLDLPQREEARVCA